MTGLAYRREIDGLRAIAVLAVVLYHAGVPALSGGFVGVDVFFVISGYLITSLLLREWRQEGRIDLAAFYVRRIRRLLPALWLVIAATLVASMALLPPMSSLMQGTLDSSIAALAFVSNMYFARNSGGYFDGPAEEMPLLHLWSLSVEEQYYLILPLALMLVLQRRPQHWRRWLALACIASFALSEYWLRHRPEAAFYQMPARFWELGLGGLIAGCSPGRLGARWPARLLLLGVVTTLLAVVATQRTYFPGMGALPAVVGAALVMYALNDSDRLGLAGRLLASRPMVAVGLISYSFYLWHWPLLAFDRALAVEPSSLAVRLALCALAALLAWGSYLWVETPFRRSGKGASRWRVLASGISASLVLVFAALMLRPVESRTPLEELVWKTRSDHPRNMGQCHFGLKDEIPALQGGPCRSVPMQEPEVVIWGDSHALAWQPLAWQIAESAQQSAIGFTLDSCPPVDGYDYHRADVPQHRDRCRRFNELVMRYLDEHRVRTLVLSGRWLVYFPATGGGDDRGGEAGAGPIAGLDRALARVSGRVERILLMAPPPQLRDSAPKCIGNQQLDACATPRVEYERMAARSRRLLAQVAARHPKVTVVDPADFFCDALQCPVMKDGYALFWDDDHVSTTAARAFARDYVRSPRRWTARWAPAGVAGMDDNGRAIATPSAGVSR